ncbi:hypothetical protein HPB50_011127 [Hyalomma asiaticum]|uniref:Uncharacterized protein n=1 Tax=Hyalomma asiaticum TaxID=266040 RepID=A0ACB7S0B6_HYAAI|nr:hypothetical protein HPB50_011127 [Hyalomma asiaticum]
MFKRIIIVAFLSGQGEFRSLVAWLEDQKIRHYKLEERAALRALDSPGWMQAFETVADKYVEASKKAEQDTGAPKMVHANPLDDLDFDCQEFRQGVQALAQYLGVTQHPDHIVTLQGVCALIQERLSTTGQEAIKQRIAQGKPYPLKESSLGFDTGVSATKLFAMSKPERKFRTRHKFGAKKVRRSLVENFKRRSVIPQNAEDATLSASGGEVVDATTVGLTSASPVAEPVQSPSASAAIPSSSGRVRRDTIYRQQSDLAEEEAKAKEKLSDLSSAAATERKRAFVDPVLNHAAKVLRLLYVQDLRDLQTHINEAIVAVQAITANPKTDTRLGKVGR